MLAGRLAGAARIGKRKAAALTAVTAPIQDRDLFGLGGLRDA